MTPTLWFALALCFACAYGGRIEGGQTPLQILSGMTRTAARPGALSNVEDIIRSYEATIGVSNSPTLSPALVEKTENTLPAAIPEQPRSFDEHLDMMTDRSTDPLSLFSSLAAEAGASSTSSTTSPSLLSTQFSASPSSNADLNINIRLDPSDPNSALAPSQGASVPYSQLDAAVLKARDDALGSFRSRAPRVTTLKNAIDAANSRLNGIQTNFAALIAQQQAQNAATVAEEQAKIDRVRGMLDVLLASQKSDADKVNAYNAQLKQSVYLRQLELQKAQLSSLETAKQALEAQLTSTQQQVSDVQAELGSNPYNLHAVDAPFEALPAP